MGVDFTLLCDHGLTWSELYDLPSRLNGAWACPSELSEFVTTYVRAGPSNWMWARDRRYSNVAEELREKASGATRNEAIESFEAGHVSLEGPDGFHGTVFERGILLVHLARWWSFLHEQDVQRGLLSAARRVAQLVRATHLLYLPDNTFPPSLASESLFEGRSVEEILAWLRTEIGPPFASPGDFVGHDDEAWDERGWFYERVAG